MENKLNINSSYSLVEKKPSFLDRHIGPSETEVSEMLDKLGFSTLDELIQATVPNQILLDAPLTLTDVASVIAASKSNTPVIAISPTA